MTKESLFGVSLFGPFFNFYGTFYVYPFFRFNNVGRIRLKIENVVSNTNRFSFQSQAFKGTNRSECVAGSKILVMVRVEVYAVSIIGSFRLSIHSFEIRSIIAVYRTFISGSGMIDSGEYPCKTCNNSL